MARKRMIDPNFWRDEKVSELTYPERLLFIGLWNFADDNGVGRANPKLLKADIFPYDDTFRVSDMEKSLAKLATLELITLYEVGGQSYFFVPNFKKHQTINKPTPSSFPTPSQLEKNTKNSITKEIKNTEKVDKNAACEALSEDSRSTTVGLRECYGSTTVGLRAEIEDKEKLSRREVEVEYMLGAEAAPSPNSAIKLPLNDNSEFALEDKTVDEFRVLYPAVNVEQQLKAMRGWLLSNPTKRKTRSGIMRFVNSWLSREQDKGRPPDAGKGNKKGIIASMEGFIKEEDYGNGSVF